MYAAYHKVPSEVEKSSSGAMFVALSDVILTNGGSVIAASYNYELHKLEHILCKSAKERDLCRGSKYFQSEKSVEIYRSVEKLLNEKKSVLYIGTPCEIVAIKKYLEVKNIDMNRLYLCDLLCHGVGSIGVWKKFLDIKSRKANITYLSFKDKRKNWLKPVCVAQTSKQEVSIRDYSWLYFENAILRPSCYRCKYATIERQSDFTIGDFWRVRENNPDIFNPRGTSFIMINSKKAEELFEIVKENLVYKEVSIEDVLQANMKMPTKMYKYRVQVMNDYRKMPAKLFFMKWRIILFLKKILKKVSH